jgi:hypothetical protein
MRDYKPWSEYRRKDYVVARSMKEAFGHDVKLYVAEERQIDWWVVVSCVLAIVLIVVL